MDDTSSDDENVETCLGRGSKIIAKITGEKCESYIFVDVLILS